MQILVTGATGFVGTALVEALLSGGHAVVGTGTSARHPASGRPGFDYLTADTTEAGEWMDAVAGADAIVNLAGRTIFKRWSKAYKEQIYASRVFTTRHIVAALPAGRPVVLCSASAAGYYGDRGDERLTETAAPGGDFLAQVCVDWEAAAFAAREKGARVATLRLGVVLGRGGGALVKMVPAFRMFGGGPLGGGRQWFPWIHLADLTAAIVHILTTPGLDGPLNFCAPGSVRQAAFAQALGRALKRPAWLPVPAVALRLLLGELGGALLGSQRSVPERLLVNGFAFAHPDIAGALADLLP